MSVIIETTLGDVTVDLFLTERPTASMNFLKLCKLKYYNYNLFHTISRGFIAQTGDPTGSRTGGESVFGILKGSNFRYFQGENKPRIKHTKMGLISFVGNDEFMLGSQFFITLGDDLTYLDDKHCVFGEVVEGFDILEIINEGICDGDDRPYQDVRITHTVILDDPFPDPEGLKIPSRSPSPSAERLMEGRIAPDEEIDEMEGKSAFEIAELQAEREAKARATILEMVGDIPDAEMAPPENVLFVCKLNPVTTDDDLEIIFNRFGTIKSCEVIRDRKTGDSLQYAFIEFEDRKACEDAYFKMDNILIDDRRIHVDFSQSVSKIKWNGKGRGVTHYDEKGRQIENDNEKSVKKSYNNSSKKHEDADKNLERSNKERSSHKSDRYENGNKQYKSCYKNDEERYSSKTKSDHSRKTSEKDSRRSPIRENKRHNSRDRNRQYEKDSRRSPVRGNRRYTNSERDGSHERDSKRFSIRDNNRYNDTDRSRTYEDKRKYEKDLRKSPVRDKSNHYRSGDRNTSYNEKRISEKNYEKIPGKGSSKYKSGESSNTSEVTARRAQGEYDTSRNFGKDCPKETKQKIIKRRGHSTEKINDRRSKNDKKSHLSDSSDEQREEKFRKQERNKRRVTSIEKNYDKRSKTDRKRYSSESSNALKEEKRNKQDIETRKYKENSEKNKPKTKKSTIKKKKSKSESSSESTSETSDDEPKRKKKNIKHSKKSDSSSSSSTDSSSEDDKRRTKKKSKKQKSSDSSSSSSTSSSTSSSSSSESSENDRKSRKKKIIKSTKKRETSDSSESEVETKRKKR